uniref:Uncharacterized protein n=1 Tax=Zea mays TaxID=4577 RepID=A0A804PSZ2_MAIZE
IVLCPTQTTTATTKKPPLHRIQTPPPPSSNRNRHDHQHRVRLSLQAAPHRRLLRRQVLPPPPFRPSFDFDPHIYRTIRTLTPTSVPSALISKSAPSTSMERLSSYRFGTQQARKGSGQLRAATTEELMESLSCMT